MSLEMKLPDIGEGLTEADIVQWLVEVGREVAANQPIVEVETAKAVVEISTPREGVLLHQGAAAGTTLEVGGLLAVIGDPGETWEGSPTTPEVDAARNAVADELRTAIGGAATATASVPRAEGGAVKAVPLIRKLARDRGIDLTRIAGTGPNGQITRGDVEAAASNAGAPAQTESVALSTMRRTIARNLSRSWTEIPHVTVWGPADATAVLAARQANGGPVEAYLIQVAVGILADFPEFNATLEESALTYHSSVGMGFAVDTDAGLVVPVVPDAGAKTHAELVSEIDRLAAAARARTLTLDDLSGGTFTISNVGAAGGGYGTPIIPHGTTAILSIGRARDEVVARDGAIRIAPMFPLALSFDHRVIDGVAGSRFLAAVTDALESFGT